MGGFLLGPRGHDSCNHGALALGGPRPRRGQFDCGPSRQQPRRGEPLIPALDRDRVGCNPAPNTCRARHLNLQGSADRGRECRLLGRTHAAAPAEHLRTRKVVAELHRLAGRGRDESL